MEGALKSNSVENARDLKFCLRNYTIPPKLYAHTQNKESNR